MILIDATPLQTAHRFRGPGVYTAGLLDALTHDSHITTLTLLIQAPRHGDMPLLAELVERSSVATLALRRPRWPRYRFQALLSLLAVQPVLRRRHPSLYHATDPLGLHIVPGVRTVATLYDLIPLHYPQEHYPLRRLEQRLGYARYLHNVKRADRLIAISEATRIDAIERLRIRPERIAVTPLAVDERHFYPRSPEEIQAVVERYGLARPYFLHVGAAAHQKNTRNLLSAFASAYQHDPARHALYIVGQWTPRTLHEVEREYGSLIAERALRILGHIPYHDLPALYGGATALLYPSLIEGFGLPVLEAMRCATPVLTAASSSLPEVGGEAALYVDPTCSDEIAQGILRLAGDPKLRADMIVKGLQHVRQFTWQQTATLTRRVYEDLL